MVAELIMTLRDLGYLEIQQVKEKFGTLRFYCSCEPEGRPLIEFVERMSENICEYCGDRGESREDLSWVSTLCNRCYTPKRKQQQEMEAEFAREEAKREEIKIKE